MDRCKAKSIVQEQKLIDSELSRKILWAIAHNTEIPDVDLPAGITPKQIEQLRHDYKQQASNNPTLIGQPRNRIFYELLANKFPDFSWECRGDNVIFRAPKVGYLEPSLLSLLLLPIAANNHSYLQERYPCLAQLPHALVTAIDVLFQQLQVIYPSKEEMANIVRWLQRGLQGERLQLFSLVCPDYSVVSTGDPLCPYLHTFNELGAGVGLIAKRALAAYPLIATVLQQFDIKLLKPVVALADYEILAESGLTRLGLTHEEFLARLHSSRNALTELSEIEIENPMITNLCDGYDSWRQLHRKYHTQFMQSDFGAAKLNQKRLLAMVKTRKALYDRWHGQRNNLQEYISLLLDQAAEYAAVGEIINRCYDNCLVLGADHSVFEPFYKIKQITPTLYLKRFYC